MPSSTPRATTSVDVPSTTCDGFRPRFDGQALGFFWFAGQGGFGIQTAPAAAMLAAAVLLGEALPEPVAAIDPERYSPRRFG